MSDRLVILIIHLLSQIAIQSLPSGVGFYACEEGKIYDGVTEHITF